MTKKWAFAGADSSRRGLQVKRFFLRPLHVALIIVGFALILSAAQIHALSTIPVSLSTHELSMQPGSELPVRVNVDTPYGKTAYVSFRADYPSSVLNVDGELNSVSTSFPLQRDFHVATRFDAPQGDYAVYFHTAVTIDHQTFNDTQMMVVHVGKKGLVTYLTSPNTTLSAQISSVVFSTESVNVGRNENASVSVSFLNQGSATDYLVRLAEPALGISARITNETHRFVQPGERVTSFIEISTSPTSPFGKIPLRVEAYDLVSGEKTYLGTVLVDVVKTTNVNVSIPFHEFVIEQDESIYSSLTLNNTEYSDVDVIVESSSSLVQIPSRQIHVPAKSSVSVPLLIRATSVESVRSETVYVLNSELTEQVSFVVSTVKKGTFSPVHDANVNDSNSSAGTPISGLFVGAFSSWLGIIVIIFAALLVFSTKFREAIVSRLPKPVSPVKGKPVEVAKKETVAPVPASPAPESNTVLIPKK